MVSVWLIDGPYWPLEITLWVTTFYGNDEQLVYSFFEVIAPCIESMDVASANTTLNCDHVHLSKINWPPFPEQHAIAKFHCSLVDKIELKRRENGTLEVGAQAFFKSWIVDIGLVRP